MASSLLDKSLDDLARQDRNGGSKPRRGAGQRSSSGRGAPYSRPGSRPDMDGAWQHDLFQTNKLDYGDEDGRPTGTTTSRDSSRGGRGSRRGVEEPRSTKLKITNLHYEVSEAELKALFIQIGPLARDPGIKYDKSGRSLGEAFVTYESEADAARAKDAFHNALAKGERISLEYDFSGPPRGARGGAGKGNAFSGDLLGSSHGAGNPLLARLGKGSAPAAQTSRTSSAASRGASNSPRGASTRGAPRGSARGGGRGAASSSGRSERRKPTTAEDLDRELEEFMAKGSSNETETAPAAAPASHADDVEMA